MTTPLRTPAEVRAEFERKGISIREWCLANGFSYQGFIHLLAGRNKGMRGSCRQAAIAVGLKHGEISGVISINELADRRRAVYAAAIDQPVTDEYRWLGGPQGKFPLTGHPVIESVVAVLRSGQPLLTALGFAGLGISRVHIPHATQSETAVIDIAIELLQRIAKRKP